MQAWQGTPALLTIDVQAGFHDPYWGERNQPQAEHNIERLVQAWRERKWPIFHIQHLSLQPESPLYYQNQAGVAFMEFLQPQPGEQIIQKNVNSAFIGTNLAQQLEEQGIQTVVMTGFSTPHCVSTTTRMSGNLGFQTYVVSDATAAFAIKGHTGITYSAEIIHELSLATLHQEFATVIATDEVLLSLEAQST